MSVNINILVFCFTERKTYVGIKFPDVHKTLIFMASEFTLKLVTVGVSHIWAHNYHSPENNDMAALLIGKFETWLSMR
jgi:hypothetical protein